MGKTRKCKNCGRPFHPKDAGDLFCSELCRTTGCFVGGGGDTRKPMNPEQLKAMLRKGISVDNTPAAKPKRMQLGKEKYPRVHQMFELPVAQRWEIAKTFTDAEREYSRRLMKKRLMDERRIDEMIEWECDGADESVGRSYEGLVGGSLGDSDDGSI